MALWYARGTKEMMEGKPASAFSKGDFLCLNSSSSLSMIPALGGIDIVGVATADSTQSVNGKVTYIVPGFDTVFWSDATAGSTFTKGANVNFNYATANRRWVANGSTGTVLAVCEIPVSEVEGLSVNSRIGVRLVSNAGGLVLS